MSSVRGPRRRWTLLFAVLLTAAPAVAGGVDPARVRAAALQGDWKQLQEMGRGVLPEMARLYTASSEKDRATIAYAFYQLGWKSPEAKRVLMADVHTQDEALRLQVQWALGRVSDDADVVDVLLENMRTDPVPLFRDKAACALAYDQIHLSPAQRMRLFEGLVHALEDDKTQVRQIPLQALQILTGQTKGFQPVAPPEARHRAVEEWKACLAEYRANL